MSTLIPSNESKSSVANRRRDLGGRYAEERRSEATLTARPNRLGAFSDLVDDDQVDLIVKSSEQAARFYLWKKQSRSGGFGINEDVQDIAQESILRFLASANKTQQVPNNIPGYAYTIAQRTVSDASPIGRRNWEIVSANAQLQKWKEEFRTEHSRDPKGAETDGQKRIIIESFAEGHRPPWDFDDANGRLAPISLEADAVSALATANFPGGDYKDDSWDPSSPMGEALTAVIEKDLAAAEVALRPSEEGASKVREKMAWMRRNSWPAFQEANPALPAQQSKSINPRRASVIRSTIDAAGGITAVCNEWSTVGDSDATEALFAPFGKITFEQQEAVVDFLTSKQVRKFENGAEILWGHTLTGATNRKRSGD